MTAQNVLNSALNLLGYNDSNGNAQLTQNIRSRAVPLINSVYSELCRCVGKEFKSIESLGDDLNIPDRVLVEVMSPGLASYIAQAEGDSSNEAFWGQIYDNKRLSLTKTEKIEVRI